MSVDRLLPANDAEAILLLKGALEELHEALSEGMDGDQPRHLSTASIAIAQVGLYLGRRTAIRQVTLRRSVEAVGLRWYALPSGECIGFVGLIDRAAADPFFKVYIGVAAGRDIDDDIAAIALRGHPLLDEVMARHLVGAHHAFTGLRYEY